MTYEGQEFPSPAEALAHYGVKGMHWGVRKDPNRPGLPTRVASYTTSRAIKGHTKALAGKGIIGKVALADKYTWGGKGRFEGYHNKSIAQLERSKERIANGEIVARTLLLGPQYSKKPSASYGLGEMKARRTDTAVTKRVKADYNRMSNPEFRSKYATDKATYAKRVKRYGDPYKSSPMAKAGKALARSGFGRTAQRSVDRRNTRKGYTA